MLQLAGQEYKARLTIDGMIRVEQQLNKGIIEVAQSLASGAAPITQISVIIEQGLRGGGNDVKTRDVHEIIREAGLINAIKAAGEIITGALGTDELEDGEDEGNE